MTAGTNENGSCGSRFCFTELAILTVRLTFPKDRSGTYSKKSAAGAFYF